MASTELTRAAEALRAQRATANPAALDLASRRRGFEASAPPVPGDVGVTAADAGGVPAD